MSLLDHFDEGFSTFYIVLFILIEFGVFTILMCCLGCCGASIRSQCMLLSVFICLLVVFSAEIVFGIWAFFNKEQVSNGLKSFYDHLYFEYWKTRSSSSKIILIIIHKMLDCCGSNVLSAVIETFVNDVCPNEIGLVSIISNALKDCYTRINKTYPAYMFIMAGVGVAIGIFLILGMVLSMSSYCAIQNDQLAMIYQQSVEGDSGKPPWTMHSGSSSHVQESFPLNPPVPPSKLN